MSITRAFAAGVRDAVGSPALVAVLWLALVAVALPAGVIIEQSIRQSIGASRVDESLLAGLDLGWLGEYEAAARGLERSVSVSMVGAGAVFDNLEAWFSGELFTLLPAAAWGALYAAVWLFLLGGVLDRLARRQRGFVLAPFVAAGARFFPRLLRLAAVSAVFYWAVYRLGRWLFPWIERRLGEVTVERTMLAAHLAGAALVVLLLAVGNLVFIYAKIALVCEGRRSALVAVLRAVRFVAARPLRAIALYGLLGLLAVALVALYAAVAPGPGQGSWPAVLAAFAVGQLYLVARLTLRLAWLGAHVRFWERERLSSAALKGGGLG